MCAHAVSCTHAPGLHQTKPPAPSPCGTTFCRGVRGCPQPLHRGNCGATPAVQRYILQAMRSPRQTLRTESSTVPHLQRPRLVGALEPLDLGGVHEGEVVFHADLAGHQHSAAQQQAQQVCAQRGGSVGGAWATGAGLCRLQHPSTPRRLPLAAGTGFFMGPPQNP